MALIISEEMKERRVRSHLRRAADPQLIAQLAVAT